jgi:hypothetical protein
MTIGHRHVRPWLVAAGGTVLGVAVAGAVLFTTALAVHDTPFPFELDGNVTNNGGNSLDDWQNVFGLDGVVPPATGTPVASGAEVFIHDLPSGNAKETQYDAGKDTLDIGAWTRKDVAKVTPDKDNITDAFAKSYMVDVGGGTMHRVIYFGMDRLANNGDAALGFWFFQNQVQPTAPNGFSPNHTAHNANTGQRGDILVQVDFINGGAQSRIEVFEWYGSGGNTAGSLQLLRSQLSNGITVCTTDDAACATANASQTGSYWPYVPKFGTSGTFPAQSLFEGGIDITALVGDVCFNSFLANTRTAHSETADLKDLALGDFNTCGSIDLVRKECGAQEGVSPIYDADAEVYQTKHTLTILNDGLGSNVFDVSIRDDAVGGDNICRIVNIAGGSGNPSIPAGGIFFPNNTTFIKVADSLAAGVPNQMMVTLLCTSPLNPFANSASIRAGQQPGGTSLTDNYAEDASDTSACLKNVPTGLEVTKSCPSAVVFDPDNGDKPKVCVNITVTNTGESKVDVSKLIDTRNGADGSSKSLLSQVPGTTHTIDPGQTVNGISDCYTPVAPDNAQTDPNLVTYSDTVSAEGHPHSALGDTVTATPKSVTCPLCPIGLDGTP